jgi:hypothetical protein
VYLDNWDSDLFWLEGGYDARAFLTHHQNEISSKNTFVDYVPGSVQVTEGLLVKKNY